MITVLAIVLLFISSLFGDDMPAIVGLALVVLFMGKAADGGQAAIAAAASPAEADSAFGCGVLTVLLIGGGFLLLVFAAVGGGL